MLHLLVLHILRLYVLFSKICLWLNYSSGHPTHGIIITSKKHFHAAQLSHNEILSDSQ